MTGRIQQGYGIIQREIMRSDVSVYSKAVYCLLVSYAGEKESCFPSLKTMCDDLQISKPTVIKSLKELIKIGFLVADRTRTVMGDFANNVYYPMYILQNDMVVNKVDNGEQLQLLPVVNEVDTKNNSLKKGLSKDKPVKQTGLKSKKEKKFIPPTPQEVIDYFKQKGYTAEAAKRAHEYYDCADWKDAKGQPVLSWKQKMISVWFKEENKITEEKTNSNRISL